MAAAVDGTSYARCDKVVRCSGLPRPRAGPERVAGFCKALAPVPSRLGYRLPVSFSQRLRARLIGLVSTALLSQFAVAAYAFSAMVGGASRGSADAMAAGVPLDPEQPALCMQHCHCATTTQAVNHFSLVFSPVTALPAVFKARGALCAAAPRVRYVSQDPRGGAASGQVLGGARAGLAAPVGSA